MTRSAARRPRPAAALLIAVALVVAGGITVTLGIAHLHRSAPRSLPRPFGVTSGTAGIRPAAGPATGAATPRTGSPAVGAPAVVAAPGPHDADGSGVPLTLSVPRLHVRAPVVPVGSDRSEITVPADPATVGWWAGGSVPGSPTGTTVVVGHVDSARSGPGALFHLDRLRPADLVTVTTSGGRQQSYRVTSLTSVVKSRGLDPGTFAADGAPRLVLITCGGPFDTATRSYADNIVAVATPVRTS